MKRVSKPKLNLQREEDCPVSGALYVMYSISRLVGLSPVCFEMRQNKCRMRVSSTLNTINCVVVTIFMVISITGLIFDLNGDPEHSSRGGSTIRRLVWTLQMLVTVLCNSVAVYGALSRTRATIDNHNRLQKIAHSLHFNKTASTAEWKLYLLLYFIVSFLVVLTIYSYYLFLESVMSAGRDLFSASMYCFFYAAILPLDVMKIQYFFLVYEAYKSLKMLNNHFENIHQVQNCRFRTRSTNYETLDHITFMYYSVFDVIRDIDRIFGLGLMAIILSTILQLELTLYNLIVNLREIENMPLTVCELLWVFLDVYWIMALVEPCHWTLQEVKRIKLLVGKATILPSKEPKSSELDRLARYLTLNQISFSAVGVCTISRSLLASITASVTTYLAILVQFQGPDRGEF